jgi:hypothetical protein
MDQIDKTKIKEIYEKLPEDLKEAIFSVETSDIIQEVSKKNNLIVDKMGILAEEVGLVILGLTPFASFVSNLATRLEIVKERADAIAKEINERIFVKIRISMRGAQEKREEQEGEEDVQARTTLAINAEKSLIPKEAKPQEKEAITQVPDILKGMTTPQNEKNEKGEAKDIFVSKMGDGIFRIKSEESEIKDEKKEIKPQSPADSILKPQYPKGDPYREGLATSD